MEPMGITAYQLAKALYFPGRSVVVPVGTSMELKSSANVFAGEHGRGADAARQREES
jgi:hypothetical protein